MAFVARLRIEDSAVHSVQTALTIYVAAVVLLTGLCCFITKEREPLFIVVCLAAMLSPNLVWDHHFVFLLLPLMVWMAWSNFSLPVVLWCCGGLAIGQAVGVWMASGLYVHAFGHASMLLLLLWQVYEVCGCGRFAWGKNVRNTLAGLIASGLLLGAVYSGWGRPGLAAMEKGDAAVHSGYPDLAVPEYTEAIRLNPNDATAYHNRAFATRRGANTTRRLPTARRRSGSTVKTRGPISTGALPSCQRVIWIRRLPIIPRPFGSTPRAPTRTIPPSASRMRRRGARGIAYVIRGEPDKAIADFTEVIRFSPQDAATYGNRGTAYARKGELDKAIADFTEAARLNPNDSTAYANRGGAYAAIGEFDNAIADDGEVIRLDPKFARAYYNRGEAYAKKGEPDNAAADFAEAARLDPKLGKMNNTPGGAKGGSANAAANFSDAIQFGPKDAAFYCKRGAVEVSNGELDRAIADFTEAIRLDPKYVSAYTNRGVVYASRGEFDKAIADHSEAIRLNPKNPEACYNRGVAFVRQGNYERAIADCDEAIRLNPKYADAYNNRGFCYAAKGDLDQAIADFSEAIRLDPTAAGIYNNRGEVYKKMGQLDKANQDFAKAKEAGK